MRLIIGLENTFRDIDSYKPLSIKDSFILSHMLNDILTKEHCLPSEVESNVFRLYHLSDRIPLERINLRREIISALPILRNEVNQGKTIYITPYPEYDYLVLSVVHMRILLNLNRFDTILSTITDKESVQITRSRYLKFIQGYVFNLITNGVDPNGFDTGSLRSLLATGLVESAIQEREIQLGYMPDKFQIITNVVDQLTTLTLGLWYDLYNGLPFAYKNPNYSYTLDLTPYGAYVNVT